MADMEAEKTPPTEFKPTDGQVHAMSATRIGCASTKTNPDTVEVIIEIWCADHDIIHAYWIGHENAEQLGHDIIAAAQTGMVMERAMRN